MPKHKVIMFRQSQIGLAITCTYSKVSIYTYSCAYLTCANALQMVDHFLHLVHIPCIVANTPYYGINAIFRIQIEIPFSDGPNLCGQVKDMGFGCSSSVQLKYSMY